MLKGRTRIELRDVRTGRTQTVEEDNMVTNALQYVFNPLGYVKAGDPMFTSAYVDYFKTLTGGLLLCIQLFFHDFQHHPGTQLKAVLENQAICNDLIFSHTIGVFLKQFFLFVCHGGTELFFVPEDQLH